VPVEAQAPPLAAASPTLTLEHTPADQLDEALGKELQRRPSALLPRYHHKARCNAALCGVDSEVRLVVAAG
jgi:hypothetical protein